ncbi:MAG TPA: HEAT repeat domain-containing protein [Aggregatilineales bacterium]|nr:HEAT repeat domain-containing protein [Anaerolineales bacterium]HRE47544.1 HEAT repeat domain-containing protein [Aggregatilineales bacterium]
MSEELDPQWRTISRFQPDEVDTETLLRLLKHDDWQVRFNAARVLRFNPDARALDELLKLFKREKHGAVRHMVALALGALHEAGVEVPLFADLHNPAVETRRNLAIKRLKELKVSVSVEHEDYIQLMIPHKLAAECFIEVGFLMAQLTEASFPDAYAPIAESVPSSVLPVWSDPIVEFVESYPHGMKFRIYRRTG